ncbi:hypothetical protein [Actinocorallia lasiicapitis]
MACPSWMLGVIREKAGAAYRGKWDVTAIPGGGGNWGGSYAEPASPADDRS